MSRSRQSRRNPGPSAPGRPKRQLARVVGLLLAIAAVAVVGYRSSERRSGDAEAPPAGAPSAPPVVEAPAAFQKLKGRWVRTDGGYVVEIRGVDASGRVDAAYFNPRSIHVARAQAAQDGGAVKLLIELRDVNYPGSTYRLAYDAGRDVLAGTYFQAVERQMYDVSFMRR